MHHTPHTPANVVPFPLHKARPPLATRVQTIADTAREDAARGLWDSLPQGHEDRIDCGDLCGMLPSGDHTPGALVSAVVAADFAVLGLFAVQTGQWMRPDLLESLMALQSAAEQARILHAPNPHERHG